MKKILAILLCVLMLCVSLSALAEGKVGVAMPTESLQRWNQDGANMKAQLEEAGYEVDLQYANNDVALQVSQLENDSGFISEETDPTVPSPPSTAALWTPCWPRPRKPASRSSPMTVCSPAP